MPKFLSSQLAELTRELSYAPPARRRQQIERAEQLYWQIEPARNYPLAFIVFRITGYRTDTGADTTLTGQTVRQDLLALVDRVSASLSDATASFKTRPVSLEELGRRWNVTAKTIGRYRKDGLFCRWAVVEGRPRIVFLPASIERFLAAGPRRLERAARFSRLDKETRKAIIRRARRIARRVEVSLFQVARHLARRYNRPTETLRQFLLRHDRKRPDKAIFPEHQPPLTDKQRQAIHRAFVRGVTVAELTRRFRRARNAIYRAINLRRAAALRGLELAWQAGPTFELDDAERIILGSPLPQVAMDDATASAKPPALSAAAESALFVRYNYLKYRAAKLRDTLDDYQPSSVQLDAIETYLRRAVAVKETLVAANLRGVVSTARKHLAGGEALDAGALEALIADGTAVLLENIETWDPGRGGRFSAYLIYNLMRHFAQIAAGAKVAPAAHRPAGELPASMNPHLAGVKRSAQAGAALAKLLAQLSEAERMVVTRHLGVGGEGKGRDEPQSLTDLAARMKLPVERVTRIERRALVKLRRTADKLGVGPAELDLLATP